MHHTLFYILHKDLDGTGHFKITATYTRFSCLAIKVEGVFKTPSSLAKSVGGSDEL